MLCLGASIYTDICEIKNQLRFTQEAKAILDMGQEIPIEHVSDISKIENSTINSYLTEEEILDVAKTLRTSRIVKNFIKENSAQDGLLYSIGNSLFSSKEIEDKIFGTFDNDLRISRMLQSNCVIQFVKR